MQQLFESNEWQMTLGERIALEGVLARIRPKLSIEIGTAEGSSLQRVAAYSDEVHSFDLAHDAVREWPANATLHSGDSHVLLPTFLAELEAEGRSADFVLVDGDHTADGVRRDLEDLFASKAITTTVILIHDIANDEVRAGVEATTPHSRPGVIYADLDFLAGHLSKTGDFAGQIWGGFGIVAVDVAGEVSAMRVGPLPIYGAREVLAGFRDSRRSTLSAVRSRVGRALGRSG